MSFFMMSSARARQEQERNRAAAVKFDNKENDGPRRYDRSRPTMDHTTRSKESRMRPKLNHVSSSRAIKKDKRIRKLKAEKIRKKMIEKYTFIPLDNITQEKDKKTLQGFIRYHQDKILGYTRREILRNFSKSIAHRSTQR